MPKGVFIAIVAIIAVVGLGWLLQPASTEVANLSQTEEVSPTNRAPEAEAPEVVVVPNPTPAPTEEVPELAAAPAIDATPAAVVEEAPLAVQGSGTYTDYSEAALAASTAEHNIIFFRASWCPSCRALEKSITESLDEIPANVAIFVADFDTETELKRKHGITLQHSFALVTNEGVGLRTWSGSPTLESLLQKI